MNNEDEKIRSVADKFYPYAFDFLSCMVLVGSLSIKNLP